jgi:hypothetical protein
MPEAISIKIEGLDKLNAAFKIAPEVVKNQIQKAIALSVALVNRNAKIEAPVKTGRLRSGIQSRISPFRGTVESTVDYGVYIHEGTSAHIIRPVNKEALYWKGADHPVKSVQHPGTKANPFMKRGASRSEGQVQLSFQKAISNVVKHLAK